MREVGHIERVEQINITNLTFVYINLMFAFSQANLSVSNFIWVFMKLECAVTFPLLLSFVIISLTNGIRAY